MPTTKEFNASAVITSVKPTAAESKTIEATLSTMRFLEDLKESVKPSNSVEHVRIKDKAHSEMMANPNVVTVDTYRAALGQWLAPQQIFDHIEGDLLGLIAKAERDLAPVAKRLLSGAIEAAKDPKQFGLAEVEAIADIAEKGAALVAFCASHKALIAEIEEGGNVIGTKMGAVNWLSRSGFCENPYA